MSNNRVDPSHAAACLAAFGRAREIWDIVFLLCRMKNKKGGPEDRNMDKPTVFISYNWGSDKTADLVEERLCPIATIERDKSSIRPWGSISDFMKKIRHTDLVVAIVSDRYLKSVACMYEIVQLLKDDDWLDHSMFVVEDSAKGIYKAKSQVEYINYWEKEKNDLEEALKELNPAFVMTQAEELRKIKYIQLNLNDFMKNVADSNNPDMVEAIDAIEKRVLQKRNAKEYSENESEVTDFSENNLKVYTEIIKPIGSPNVVSEEAYVMLLYAAVGNGEVEVSETLAGSTFLTGGKFNLNRGQDPREIAVWEDAVQALVSNGYMRVKYRGRAQTIYKVTRMGYEIADGFKASNNINTECTPSETLDRLRTDQSYEVIDDPEAQALQQYLTYDPYSQF